MSTMVFGWWNYIAFLYCIRATNSKVLYMTEVEEVMFEETPEYTLENYLSDVGGAAGLILGMSG